MSRLVVREALPSRSLELLTFAYFAVRLRAALMQSYQQSDGYLPPKEVTGGEQERGEYLLQVVQLSLAFTTVYQLGLEEVRSLSSISRIRANSYNPGNHQRCSE